MSTRIEGIIDRLTDAESFDDIKWIVGDGIIRNYAQSIVDDHIKANAEFQGNAGLEVTVERVSVGETCKWCLARCGKFTYPDVPKGIWDRHVDCDCYIIYDNGRVKQTLTGKDTKWNVVSEEVSERKKVGLTKPTAKELEARKIVGLDEAEKEIKERSEPAQQIIEQAQANNIKYNEVTPLDEKLSDGEIIDRLADGDMTKGSCVSLCYAYTGNKAGWDVLDFRGGTSQWMFALNMNCGRISELKGVKSVMVQLPNDYKAAKELTDKMERGKDYILVVGHHGSIVRKTEEGLQYLELQSAKERGFHPLNSAELKSRFGCKKSHSFAGSKFSLRSYLIDCESLYNNDEFKEILGYINTAADAQKKGALGTIK